MDDLSPAERALVQQHRQAQAQQRERHAFQLQAIATAHAFALWSEEHNLSLTFSTFVNRFNYQEDNSQAMFEAVQRILEAALPK